MAVKIYGQVQGVGFRYYAREKAEDLALFVFVQNKSDGTVCIEAEGKKKDILEDFLEWCRKGPQTAKVEKVEFIFSEGLKKFDGFRIA